MNKKELEKHLEQTLNNLSKVNCSNKIKAQSLVETLENLGVLRASPKVIPVSPERKILQ